MRAALLLAALVLVPAAAASGSSAPFTLGPNESVTFRLELTEAATVGFALKADVATARDLTVNGPGACDLDTTATAIGNGATLDMVRCVLPAGTHAFTVHLGVGVAKGWVEASKGRWL